MKTNRLTMAATTVSCLTLLTVGGCSSSSSDSDNGDPNVKLSATVVDPYIEGAVFCILSDPTPSADLDAEENQQCAEDDIRSTPSDADGVITFELDEPLPEGALILADEPGTHNGVEYPVKMAALLDDGAEDGDHFVISPMTTVRGRTAQIDQNGEIVGKLSTEDIVQMLENAGMAGMTEEDVSADPMEGMAELTSPVVDDDLVRIQSALSAYGLLLVYDQSVVLRGLPHDYFLESGLGDSDDVTTPDGEVIGDAIHQILTFMVDTVQGAVNGELISKVQQPIDAANDALDQSPLDIEFPDVSAEVLINGSVSVMDKIAAETAEATAQAFAEDPTSDWHLKGLETAQSYLTHNDFQDLLWEQGISYYGAHFSGELQAIIDGGPPGTETMEDFMGSNPEAIEAGRLMDIGMACAADHTGYFEVVRENPGIDDEGDDDYYALKYQCIE